MRNMLDFHSLHTNLSFSPSPLLQKNKSKICAESKQTCKILQIMVYYNRK